MNTKATLDFCKMVIEYMKLDCEINPLEGYAINYGEIDSWVKKYPTLAKECMEDGTPIADISDELVEAIYKFAIMTKYVHS